MSNLPPVAPPGRDSWQDELAWARIIRVCYQAGDFPDAGEIYGTITVGDLWRFGLLHRTEKLLAKDIDSFRIPTDLEELFGVLIGILKPAALMDTV